MLKSTYFFDSFQDIVTEMDENLKKCKESMLNFEFKDFQWTQLTFNN